MNKPFLLAMLLATTAVADARRRPPPPPQPVFEIQRLDTRAPKRSQDATLLADGSWTFVATDDDGKVVNQKRGAVAADVMKPLADELAAAKWTIKTAQIHCMAISPAFTRYLVRGKVVFEQHVCDGKSLDPASEKARKDAAKALAPAFAEP